jgi:hypothetical protein
MKSFRAESTSDLFNMVEALEQDIGALKLTILKKMLPQTKKPTSLRKNWGLNFDSQVPELLTDHQRSDTSKNPPP